MTRTSGRKTKRKIVDEKTKKDASPFEGKTFFHHNEKAAGCKAYGDFLLLLRKRRDKIDWMMSNSKISEHAGGKKLSASKICHLSYRKEQYLWAVVLLIVALLVSWPCFSSNHLLHGFDIVFHLGRIEGIKDAFLSGQFPVRVNPFQLGGYGMPTDIFYPDVFLYIPAFLRIAGVPLLACWKVHFIIVNILTVFCSWWAFSVYLRSVRSGAVAALVYEVFLFRLIMIYVASAASSPLAMAFFPGALVAIWVTIRRDASYWPAAVFFSTCILLSHIVTSVFLVVATIVMLLVSWKRLRLQEVRKAVGKSTAFIFLMNIWFYGPLWYFQQHMDYEMKSVTHREIDYGAISYLQETDFYTGSVLLLVLLAITVYMFLHRKQVRILEYLFLTVGSALVIFLVSRPWPWHFIGHWAGLLQFPSRLTIFPMVFLSIAIARGFEAIGLEKLWVRRVAIVCALFTIGGNFLWLSGYTYSIPLQERQSKRLVLTRSTVEHYLATVDYSYWGYKDYMDVRTRDHILNAPSETQDKEEKMRTKFLDRTLHPSDRILSVQRKSNDFIIKYSSGESEWVQLPIFWYIGYTAEDPLNAKRYNIYKDEDGQVSVLLPPSAGVVHVSYGGLPWFHFTDLISWFSYFSFLYVVMKEKKKGDERII